MAVPDVDLQWAPFHTILMKGLSDSSSGDEALDQADREFKVVPRHSPAMTLKKAFPINDYSLHSCWGIGVAISPASFHLFYNSLKLHWGDHQSVMYIYEVPPV